MLLLQWPFDLALDLFAVAHAAAAGAVTVHVLLRKRNVRAAIGWIGLAWLSPAFGALLYYALGINRVSRRAARLRYRGVAARKPRAPRVTPAALPDNIAIVADVGERVVGRPLTPGNKLTPLRGGDEAYPAMIAAIAAAKRSVALQSYIFRADEAGLPIVAALAAARARGVEVRVLIDGIGGGYLISPIARALARAGIPAARFFHDWLPWRMPFLNMRSHKKILVVDGAIGFTGGLNIGAENVAALRRRRAVDDIHFRVDGPVVSQLMLTFAEDWNFATGELLEGEAWWPELAPAGPLLARGISSGPDEDVEKLDAVLATATAAARKRLRIVTPYFLPEQHLMSALALAALRGVEVEIVIPARSDHFLLDWAMRAHLGFFGVPDVRFYLTPPPFDHAKLMTMDGRWCFLGSANWDARSMRLNFEFNLECYGEDAVAAIDRMIDARIARAHLASRDELTRRPLPQRLRDAAARLLLPYL
ncbi:MAG TPA: phospholipase D-like domain-containing protein [Alphaproteobacteria bacterium]|nr:phospholipase D-like domain-containing protein [Alphaproteobacteria bacterium]